MAIDISSFTSAAKAMKNKRNAIKGANSDVEPVKETVADILAAANAIKESRNVRTLGPSPLPVQRFAHFQKAFICKDYEGTEVCAGVSDHAIEQFARRYQYVDSTWLPNSMIQVESKMREIFNKGQLVNFDRNQHRDLNCIRWVSGDVRFIVNVKGPTIVTCILTGSLEKFNKCAWRFLRGELKCKLFGT